MALTYKILGGDGNQYGPVMLPELQTWITEGRVGPATQVLRSDRTAWTPASGLDEIQARTPTSTPAPVPAQPGVRVNVSVSSTTTPLDPAIAAAQLERQIKSGASWFYWIAGLSLINSVVALSGSQWGFILGLGVTQLIDGIAGTLGGAGKAVALVLDLMAAGLFVLFGVFAHRRQAWSFIVGMVLYALDGLLYLITGQWLAFGFHVFALFCIFSGYAASKKLSPSS